MNKTAALVNSNFIDQLSNSSTKTAAELSLSEVLRDFARDEGIARSLLEFEKVEDSELTPQFGNAMIPVLMKPREAHTAVAASIPFGGGTLSYSPGWDMYPIFFQQITTRQMRMQLNYLRTCRYDIRGVLTDHLTLDLLDKEDEMLLGANGTFMDIFKNSGGVAAAGNTSAVTGEVQWKSMYGGWLRANVIEAFNALPAGKTKLKPRKILINHLTQTEFRKWDRIEAGGDISEKLLLDGKAVSGMLQSGMNDGEQWLTTIKEDLVPRGTMYMVGAKQYFGHFCALTDATMYSTTQMDWVEWLLYETVGGGIGNCSSVARRDLTEGDA